MNRRQLVLEDGSIFIGKRIGSEKQTSGEIVFNTSMTGYQEVISDPSYCGQIVAMTYPMQGNYGINRDDFETPTPFIHGFVAKEVSEVPSNFRSEESLDHFLKKNHISGVTGIDTRKLTKIIRKYGTMKAVIAQTDIPAEDLIRTLKTTPLQTDQVKQTSTAVPYIIPGRGMRVVVADFGAKHGILRELTKRNCHIAVVPYDYGAEEILELKPDGLLLANGPGDPKNIPAAIAMIKQLQGGLPIFGIGIGHQLLALANGADTEKMKAGHHGAGQPVKDLLENKTYLTSQNHGYVVRQRSLYNTNLELTQIALNDDTVEGLKHKFYPAFSVQYHPEGAPGPNDTNYLFDIFLKMMEKNHSKKEVEVNA